MSTLKTFVSVGIQEIELENDVIEVSGLKCETFLNSTNLDTFLLGDEFSKSILPLLSPRDRIRFVIKETSSDLIVGCISFSTALFLKYNGKVVAKWITLFDSPEDDEYDGDFTEDDQEAPRALFYLVTDSAENIKQLEETLLGCTSFNSPLKTLREKTPIKKVAEPQNLQEELATPPRSKQQLANCDRENGLSESCFKNLRENPYNSEVMELHRIPQNARKECFTSPKSTQMKKTKEKDDEAEYSNSERAHSHEIVLDTDLLQFDADMLPEAPSELKCERHLLGETLKNISSNDENDPVVNVGTEDCTSQNIQQTSSQQTLTSQNPTQSEASEDKNFTTLQSQNKIEETKPSSHDAQTKMPAVRVTPKTKSHQSTEPELRQTKLELEKMTEMFKESQRLADSLKAKNAEYEQMMKKIQNQIIETCGSFKVVNEENLTLKSRVKELESALELNNKDFHELSQRVAKTQSKHVDAEKKNFERQNLRIQNLENIIQDLREQLQQAQSTNDVLQSSNKNISDAQSELISRIKKYHD